MYIQRFMIQNDSSRVPKVPKLLNLFSLSPPFRKKLKKLLSGHPWKFFLLKAKKKKKKEVSPKCLIASEASSVTPP